MKLIGHQGDVCFYSVSMIPNNLITDNQTKLGILAYGELSGHAHQFVDLDAVEVSKYAETGLLYINVKRRVGVSHGRARDFVGKEADHDYHNVIFLDPGKYCAGIVEETDWLTKTIRRVAD